MLTDIPQLRAICHNHAAWLARPVQRPVRPLRSRCHAVQLSLQLLRVLDVVSSTKGLFTKARCESSRIPLAIQPLRLLHSRKL